LCVHVCTVYVCTCVYVCVGKKWIQETNYDAIKTWSPSVKYVREKPITKSSKELLFRDIQRKTWKLSDLKRVFTPSLKWVKIVIFSLFFCFIVLLQFCWCWHSLAWHQWLSHFLNGWLRKYKCCLGIQVFRFLQYRWFCWFFVVFGSFAFQWPFKNCFFVRLWSDRFLIHSKPLNYVGLYKPKSTKLTLQFEGSQ
jgi:hypothetical protein